MNFSVISRARLGAASSVTVAAISLSLLVLPAPGRAARPGSDRPLPESVPGAAGEMSREVAFDQKLGATVPLDARFRDEDGRLIPFGQTLAAGRPAILLLGYHECPMLCSAVLNGLIATLHDLKWTAGREFDLIDVSIDPAEPVSLAASKRRIYLKRYSRPGAAAGWHFLTAAESGDDRSIRQLADSIGFRYRYDPATKQYAHASGFAILTPDGRVSRYFFGINFDPAELHAALAAAGAREVSRTPIEQFLILCFHYNPIQGKYGALIMHLLRAGAVGTIVAMGAGIYWLSRSPRRREPQAQTADAPVPVAR